MDSVFGELAFGLKERTSFLCKNCPTVCIISLTCKFLRNPSDPPDLAETMTRSL